MPSRSTAPAAIAARNPHFEAFTKPTPLSAEAWLLTISGIGLGLGMLRLRLRCGHVQGGILCPFVFKGEGLNSL